MTAIRQLLKQLSACIQGYYNSSHAVVSCPTAMHAIETLCVRTAYVKSASFKVLNEFETDIFFYKFNY